MRLAPPRFLTKRVAPSSDSRFLARALTVDCVTCSLRAASVHYVGGHAGVPGPNNEGHTANAGFAVTDGGVALFDDALGIPALGYRLLQRIREVTDRPLERIVVRHYHAGHIYGPQAIAEHPGDRGRTVADDDRTRTRTR